MLPTHQQQLPQQLQQQHLNHSHHNSNPATYIDLLQHKLLPTTGHPNFHKPTYDQDQHPRLQNKSTNQHDHQNLFLQIHFKKDLKMMRM
jgi:hypothetical protein